MEQEAGGHIQAERPGVSCAFFSIQAQVMATANSRFYGDAESLDSESKEPSDGVTYHVIRSGPAVESSEVELSGIQSLEVLLTWGTSVIHVAHHTPPSSVWIGESVGDEEPCE